MYVVFLPQIMKDIEDNPSDPNRTGIDNPVGKHMLPNILLTNLQSFGKPGKSDKTTELELVLDLNDIDVGIFTETWATDAALKGLEFEEYTMFHAIRKNCLRLCRTKLILLL